MLIFVSGGEDMNERLKEIRLFNELSQSEFGKRIGIESRAHISSLESGKRNITDRIVTDVCREFNVNEKWLRTGNGDMFTNLPEEDVYFKYATQLSNDPLFVSATIAYGKASPEFRKHLLNFFRDIYNNMDEQN